MVSGNCFVSYGNLILPGVIHIVDHPVIPPPSIFQELFMFPHFFSTFVSLDMSLMFYI